MEYFVLAVAAVGVGWVASMIGVGGGIFMVPLLAFFYVPTTQIAVGTSLAAIVFNSLSSTLGYAKRRVVDFRLGAVLLPTALVGAWLGAFLTRYISSGGLAVAFGVLLLYVAVLMLGGREPKTVAEWLRRRPSASSGGEAGAEADENPGERFSPLAAGIVGVLAGMISGFFGVGGGVVMVPAMNLLLGVDLLTSVATSLFVMGPSALVGSLQHYVQGNVRLDYALPLALGIVVGAQLGTYTATRVPRAFLRRLFGAVLLYSAVNMILKGLSLPLSLPTP